MENMRLWKKVTPFILQNPATQIGLKNPSNFNQVKTILLYSLKNSFPKKYNSIILNFKQHLLNNFEIPDHFIKIDHIPTTLSGKIKKKYLYKKFKYKYYNNEKN